MTYGTVYYMSREAGLTADEREREIVQKNCIRFRHELGEALGIDVSQQMVADMSGLSLDAVRGFEQGRRVPERKSIIKLSAVFGRPFEHFLDADPPPPDPAKRKAWFVHRKVLGKAPAGLEEAIDGIIARYRAISDVIPGTTVRGSVSARGAEKLRQAAASGARGTRSPRKKK